MADLRVKFCGLDFKNPILVASAEPSNSVANIKSASITVLPVLSSRRLAIFQPSVN